MTNATSTVLVVRDEWGALYVFNDAMLAHARATAAQQVAIKAELDDVHGFFTPVPIHSARSLNLSTQSQFATLRLALPRSLAEARPAIGPRPGG